MKSRKIKALLLALTLTASMPAIANIQEASPVSAQIITTTLSGECGQNATWTLDSDGLLTISGEGNMYNWENNNTSSATAPWNKYAHLIKKIVICKGVTSVGDYAFKNACSLKSVQLPDSINYLGKYAFSNCGLLEKFDLPSTLTIINEGLFSNCTSLKSITIPDTVEIIDNYAFKDCSAFTEITIPDSVFKLGRGVFNNCTALASVELSDNITVIRDYTFGNCKALTELTSPEELTIIEDSAFSNCTNLERITIPANVADISISAFQGCKSMSVFAVDSNNPTYSHRYGVLFNKDMTTLIYFPMGKKAKSYTIPESVTNIIRMENEVLETVVFSENLTTMDDLALYYCPNLTSLHFPQKLGSISKLNNSKLKEITVDSSNKMFKVVDNVLFTKQTEELILYPGAKEDTSYTIPEETRGIAADSFYGTTNLKELHVHGNLSYYDFNAIDTYNTSITDFYFDGTEEEWSELSEVVYSKLNMHFKTDIDYSDVLYNEDKGLRGDINNDGVVSAVDLLKFYRYLLGKEDDIVYSEYRFDVKTDGIIDISDVIRLKLSTLGDITLWDNTNIPVMDGSTSAIPLETGFKSKMLGISYSEARELVSHHKTHESFQLLLDGTNDLIFTVPISEEQKKMAKEAGKDLILTPVAKEGFVFIVNKDNPVDSLTQEQIRDIYSGKITNWSQVGGNDEEIIPYQRNKDSGSQNCMTDFMSGYDLMEAPKSYYLGSMSAIIDGVAFYDNSTRAIGYSVYSYAAKMYENMADVKFIAVDGVKPSNETMANNTYPLLSNTFIAYTDEASADTIKFAQWAISEEGQQCVLESGYVPLEDMEIPQHLRAYDKTGTGKEKPADYKPSEKYSYFSKRINLTDQGIYGIEFLKNKEFQDTINEEVNETLKKYKNFTVMAYAKNGYMSVVITDNDISASSPVSNVLEVLNYNLIDNVKIENFSDLFYKDTEFVEMINQNISNNITAGYQRVHSGPATPYDIVIDFQCLIGNVDKFTLSEVIFDKNSYYFKNPTAIEFTSYYTPDYMVTEEYFDLNNVINAQNIYEYNQDEWEVINIEKDGMVTQQIGGSRFHTDDEVEKLSKIYDIVYADAMERQSNKDNPSRVIIDQHNLLNALYVNYGKTDGPYDANLYDIETGERIYLSDIFGDEFKEYDDLFYYLQSIDTENNSITFYTFADANIEKYYDPDKLESKYIK